MIDWINKNKDIVLAILDGKEIEYKSYRDYDVYVWEKCTHFEPGYEYRIKPEYRPFTYDEFFDLMLRRKFLIRDKMTNIVYNTFALSHNNVRFDSFYMTFPQLLIYFEIIFEDKTTQPCGVLK